MERISISQGETKQREGYVNFNEIPARMKKNIHWSIKDHSKNDVNLSMTYQTKRRMCACQ